MRTAECWLNCCVPTPCQFAEKLSFSRDTNDPDLQAKLLTSKSSSGSNVAAADA